MEGQSFLDANDMERSETENANALAKVCHVIADTFDTILDRPHLEKADQEMRAITMQEFIEAVRLQIPTPIMPDKGLEILIESYVRDLRNDVFHRVYGSGDIVCLLPTPCNERGTLYQEGQTESLAHLHLMIVDSKNKRRIAGWPGKSSPLFQFLPEEMQKEMSFSVPEDPKERTPEKIAELLTTAYRRGQFYFDQAGAQENLQ